MQIQRIVSVALKATILFPNISQFSSTEVPAIYSKIPQRLVIQHMISKKVKQAGSILELKQLYQNSYAQILQAGLTIFLQNVNKMYKEVHNIDKEQYWKFYCAVSEIPSSRIYEKGQKLSIWKKIAVYTENHLQQYQEKQKKLEEDLLKELQQNNLSVHSLVNLISIFKIENCDALINEILKQLNNKVDEIDQLKMSLNFWKALLKVISKIQWGILAQYQNLVQLLYQNEDYSIQSIIGMDRIVDTFNIIISLELHKVGLYKIPKILNKCAALIQKDINNLSIKNLIITYQAFRKLPLTFHPEIQYKLKSKFLQLSRRHLQEYQTSINFWILQQKISQIVPVEKELEELIWKRLISLFNQLPNYQIVKGRILNLIHKKIESLETANDEYFGMMRQYIKFILLGDFCAKRHHTKYLKIIKPALNKFYKACGYSNIMRYVSFPQMVSYLQVYDEPDSKQAAWIKAHILDQMQRRSSSSQSIPQLFYGEITEIVRRHVESNNRYMRQILRKCIEIIMKMPNNSVNFFRYKLKVAVSIFHIKRSRVEWQFLEKIIHENSQRINNKIFIEYFFKQGNKTPNLISNLLYFLSKTHITINDAIQLIAPLNPHLLINSRGVIHRELLEILKKQQKQLVLNKSNLNLIDKFFSNLFNLEKHGFLADLFIYATIQITNTLIEQKQIGIENTRLITKYVDNFGKISPNNTNLQQLEILKRKFLKIYEQIDQDDSIYFSTKHIQLIVRYFPDRGLQIDKLHSVKEKIKNSALSPKLSEVAFLLLKNYCEGLIDLSQQQALQYYTMAERSVKQNVLTVESLSNTIPHTQSRFEKKIIEKLNKYIRPLYIESIKHLQNVKKFYILRDYIIFFKHIKDYDSVRYLHQILLQEILYPSQLFFIIGQNPAEPPCFDLKAMELIMNKVKTNLKNMVFDSFFVLYFIECFYSEKPQRYDSVITQLYKYNRQSIRTLAKHEDSLSNSLYKSQFFIKSLFCYIKSGVLLSDQIFLSTICQVLESNQHKLLKIFDNNKLHQLAQTLLYYLKINSNPIKFVHEKRLEKYLADNSIQYVFKHPSDGLLIKYYLPQTDEVVVVAFPYHMHHEKSLRYYGSLKFQVELMKLSFNKKVRVFNYIENKFDS